MKTLNGYVSQIRFWSDKYTWTIAKDMVNYASIEEHSRANIKKTIQILMNTDVATKAINYMGYDIEIKKEPD